MEGYIYIYSAPADEVDCCCVDVLLFHVILKLFMEQYFRSSQVHQVARLLVELKSAVRV